jgi:uncharacterized protein (DUF58 family)
MADARTPADEVPSLLAEVRARLRRLFRPRRRLRATGAGRALIVITLAVGFAAFNTGNNLLFFGWGLLLSSIVVSGILSEATLQAVAIEPRALPEVRAKARSVLPFYVVNHRRVPAFAVDVGAVLEERGTKGPSTSARSFELRIEPGGRKAVDLGFVPRRRGVLAVESARASTAFPFGFFEKEKRVFLDAPIDVVVLPARVDVSGEARDVLARIGEAPARRVGPGDELFSLRPFHAGDDPRRIAWRRAARTNRFIVRETEAARSNDILLDIVTGDAAAPADVDHALDVAASLAEDLLRAGQAVGVRGPGVALEPASGPRQRSAILARLAVLDARAPRETVPARRAAVIAVVARGASPPADVAAVVLAERVPAAEASS